MKQCLCKNRTKEIQAALTRLPPTRLRTVGLLRVPPKPIPMRVASEKSGPSYGATKPIKGKKQPSETTSPLD
jgi:hypothetical protein